MKVQFYLSLKMAWLIIIFVSLSNIKLHAQVYANSQVNGVTGLCLICGVSNPNNPVDNSNLNDYSTFSITAGLLGTTVYQTLIFPAVSTTGCDSLVIGIGSGDALLSVNLFAGITVQTFNGVTANNDVQQITASNLSLLQNNTRAEVLLKPANTFDRVKITLSSSLVGLLNGFRLYYAYRKPSTPTPVTVDSTAICAGDSATLAATVVNNATIRWYNASSSGSLLYTGNNYRVSPATTTTYYAEASLNGCNSVRKAVKVIVNPRPANPTYTLPQSTVCGNQIITVSNYQPGINYNVRAKYSNYVSVIRDTSYTVVNSNTVIVTNFSAYSSQPVDIYIQAVNAVTGCKSDSVHKLFVFGATAELPTVDADSVTICYDQSATLHAYIPISSLPTIRWYDAPTGGNLLYSGNYYTVSPSVTTTYYVTAAVPCEYPQRRPVKVIVTKLPAPNYVLPEGYTCGIVHKFPILNHQSGFNYNVRVKYTNSIGVILLDTSYVVVNKDTIITTMQPQTLLMQGDIYVQAVNPINGCKSDTVHQIFIVGSSSVLPSVDADSINLCSGDSATLHAFVPNTSVPVIRWYDASSGGNLLFTGNYYKVGPLVNTTYYVTSAYLCDYPQRKPVKVTISDCLARNTLISKEKDHSPSLAIKQLQLYPNPTRGEIRLATKEDLSGSLVIIKDLNGREIQREILKKNGLSISKQAGTGLYFIQVITPKKEIYSGKILLQL
jgi:hypothetical protein